MKHESDESGIIVYDMHDDYSLGRSSKSNKTKDREEKKENATSNQKYANNESMALLGGFSGRVYDKLTYRTIEGASVTIAKDLSIKTDEKGIFIATGIKPGKYRITVFEEGYMIQSCRSTAVAGETTKLDSFHLIPDCLVAEYPDDIVKEEEETAEEGLVEFALEVPQSTLSEESTRSPEAEDAIKEEPVPKEAMSGGLSEQIAQVSSDKLVVEDIHTEIALDLEIRKGITEEKTIEHLKKQISTKNFMPPQGGGGEVFSTFEEISEEAADRYIDIVAAAVEEKKEISPDEIIAALLEQIQTAAIAESTAEAVISPTEEEIAIIEEPSIAEISLAPVEPVIAEAKQPEESLEKTQKEAPLEITMEETPIEIAAEVLIQEEIGRVTSQEAYVEPSAGEASQETTHPPEQQEQLLASSSEVVPETAVEEVVQPTETPQAPVGEKSRLGKLWKSLRTKIVKELELSQGTSAEPPEEAVQETTPPLEQQEQALRHPGETASGTATQEMISEKPHVEAQAIAVTLEEMPVSTASRESTETAVSVSAKTIVEDISSVDEPSWLSIETGTAEAKQPEEVPRELFREEVSVEDIAENGKEEAEKEIPQEKLPEPPIEVAPEITALEEFIEEVYEGELLGPSVDVSLKLTAQEEALGEVQEEDPTVDVFLKGIPTLAMFADSAEVTIPAPEEPITGDIFLIDPLPHMFVETDIAEMTQPEEVLLEISGAESPVETTAEEMAQAEIIEEVYHEQPLEPSVEVAPEITAWEEVVEEVHKEESLEPPLDVALDLTVHEEIAEVTQPEGVSREISREISREVPHEVPGEVPGEGSGSKLVWWTRRKRKTRSVDQEQPPEPSMGISSQIAPQEEVLGEAEQKESTLDVSVDKKTISIPAETIQTPVDAIDLTATVTSATKKTVLEGISTVNEFLRMPMESGTVEITQPEEAPQNLSAKETPVENIVKETTQDRIKDGPHRKKLSVDISVEEVVKTPTVDEDIDKIITAPDNCEVAADVTSAEDSVAHEKALAGISDDDLASMSNEEKEALSHGHESVEVEGFIGIINAQPNPAYKGLPISIAYTLRNVSCDNPDDFIVQIYVVNPDTDIIYDTLEIPVKCSKGTFSMGGFVIFTTSYETYVYRLIMQIVSKKTKTAHLLADIPLEIKSIY